MKDHLFWLGLGLAQWRRGLDRGALLKIPRFFLFVMKYIAPGYLLVVLVGYAAQNLVGPALKKTTGDPVGLWTLVIIVEVIVLLVGILYWRVSLARSRSRSRYRWATEMKRLLNNEHWQLDIYALSSLALVWGTIWAYFRLLRSPREEPRDREP